MAKSIFVVRKFTAYVLLMSFVLMFAFGIAAYAQDGEQQPAAEGAAGQQQQQQVNTDEIGGFWWLLKSGGVPEIILIVMSIAGVTLVIEDFVSLRMDKLVPPVTLDDVEGAILDGNYDEAIDICESDDCYLTRVLHPALLKTDYGFDDMKEVLLASGEIESTKLQQKVGWLSLIAALAPMVGLLGTVSGMLSAFMIMAKNPDNATPATLAAGISGALVTTVSGLFVAIPLLFFYYFFRNRVMRAVQEVDKVSAQLLDNFKPNAKR